LASPAKQASQLYDGEAPVRRITPDGFAAVSSAPFMAAAGEAAKPP